MTLTTIVFKTAGTEVGFFINRLTEPWRRIELVTDRDSPDIPWLNQVNGQCLAFARVAGRMAVELVVRVVWAQHRSQQPSSVVCPKWRFKKKAQKKFEDVRTSSAPVAASLLAVDCYCGRRQMVRRAWTEKRKGQRRGKLEKSTKQKDNRISTQRSISKNYAKILLQTCAEQGAKKKKNKNDHAVLQIDTGSRPRAFGPAV